ncbi:MAG TPA: hypothetical protein VJZ00_03835 [Thermoanaerobaculia bacterium]|nr:hypothetical protein [Thermoanaerobaculia bacterium]
MTSFPTMTEQKSTRPTAVTEASKYAKKTMGEDAAPAPSHSAKFVPRDYKTINGWGADLDPKDRPSVPRELPSDVMTARGDVKHRQTAEFKVFRSNEHPDLTPVFGTSCPPHGLSGLLREYAYNYGEATNRHWLTLIFADRVDILESSIRDLFRGKPDHYIKEKGWGARIRNADTDERSHGVAIAVAALGTLALGVFLARKLRTD